MSPRSHSKLVVSPVTIMTPTISMVWVLSFMNGLTLFWSPVDISTVSEVCETMRILMLVIGFHFKDEITTMNKRLRCAERSAIMVEGGVIALVPPSCVEGIEVVLPVEVESICAMVVCVCLNIVIDAVPWHVNWVETMSP